MFCLFEVGRRRKNSTNVAQGGLVTSSSRVRDISEHTAPVPVVKFIIIIIIFVCCGVYAVYFVMMNVLSDGGAGCH